MNTTDRIKRSVANRSADVFVRSDFASFGSPAQVSRALQSLQTSGTLVKLGLGVYAKAKPSVLSGKPIPVRPIEVLAPIALRKLGIRVQPSKNARAYNSGQTTQIPAGVVLNTGRSKIARKLGFNGKFVRYERG